MQVFIPTAPRFDPTSSELEKLLVELGYPAKDDLDDESEELADTLVQEYAVLARRGWLVRFDLEFELDTDEYASTVCRIVNGADVCHYSVRVEGHRIVVRGGDNPVACPVSEIDQDANDDWMDVTFIAHLAARALAPRGRVVVVDLDEQSAVVASLPPEAWRAGSARDLMGDFGIVRVS